MTATTTDDTRRASSLAGQARAARARILASDKATLSGEREKARAQAKQSLLTILGSLGIHEVHDHEIHEVELNNGIISARVTIGEGARLTALGNYPYLIRRCPSCGGESWQNLPQYRGPGDGGLVLLANALDMPAWRCYDCHMKGAAEQNNSAQTTKERAVEALRAWVRELIAEAQS